MKLMKERKLRYCKDEKQVRMTAWRQIFGWIKAQLALIETGMVSFVEVFLPYMLIEENVTVFEKYKNLPQLENKEDQNE